jgi:signal transduction histidine kinase
MSPSSIIDPASNRARIPRLVHRLDQPWAAHLDPTTDRLFRQLARSSEQPLSAECALIVLETSPELWTAHVWSAGAEPRVLTIPAAPPSAWLASVVGAGARFAIFEATAEDAAAHGGFPWLDDAQAWLALPIEDGSGARIGAIAVASRKRSLPWKRIHDRRLLEIVEASADDIERIWSRLELTRMRRERNAAQEECADARQQRDAMIAVLGHELRNPLAPLVTALELLWETAPEGLHPELAVMNRQLKQLGRVVDELVDFAQLFRGEVELDIRRLRLRDVLLGAAEQSQSILAARDHALVADVAEELEIEADPARVQQIVGVLLSNAAKHTPPRRTIVLCARAEGDSIEIHVADDGGVDARVLASAFEPFQAASAPGSGSGLGLGLPIARALAAAHGGMLELRSSGPTHGTEAVVRLPRQQAGTNAGARVQHRDPCPALPLPLRVLVVDDNRDAADLLADVIRRWSGSAVVAYDGPTALEHARETRFDVALVDIGLPQMSGLELARQLRSLPGSNDLQIIAVTGFGEPSDRERSLEAGMDAHLVKPISMLDLRKILTEAYLP